MRGPVAAENANGRPQKRCERVNSEMQRRIRDDEAPGTRLTGHWACRSPQVPRLFERPTLKIESHHAE
jgi:hypothetical protein